MSFKILHRASAELIKNIETVDLTPLSFSKICK